MENIEKLVLEGKEGNPIESIIQEIYKRVKEDRGYRFYAGIYLR